MIFLLINKVLRIFVYFSSSENMIKVLDDDEVSFLDLVDRSKEEEENKRWKEEMKEIREYRISFVLG